MTTIFMLYSNLMVVHGVEIFCVVAEPNKVKLLRQGAVGFIDWLVFKAELTSFPTSL